MIIEWTYLIDTPDLRIQQNPDNPNDINVDRKSWDGGYYTVKYFQQNVKYRHPEHLRQVGRYLIGNEYTLLDSIDEPFLWSKLFGVFQTIIDAYKEIDDAHE